MLSPIRRINKKAIAEMANKGKELFATNMSKINAYNKTQTNIPTKNITVTNNPSGPPPPDPLYAEMLMCMCIGFSIGYYK